MFSLKYFIYLAVLLISAEIISVSALSMKSCNPACTREYDPQCAILTDGTKRVFGNKCLLDFEKCTGKIGKKNL